MFHVERADTADKPIIRAYTYACLGKILGSEKFSFNVLSRSHDLEQAGIENLIPGIHATALSQMDRTGMRYNVASTCKACGTP